MTRDRSKLGRAIADLDAQIEGLERMRAFLIGLQVPNKPTATRKPRRTKADNNPGTLVHGGPQVPSSGRTIHGSED